MRVLSEAYLLLLLLLLLLRAKRIAGESNLKIGS
jgi:hypothetical protein